MIIRQIKQKTGNVTPTEIMPASSPFLKESLLSKGLIILEPSPIFIIGLIVMAILAVVITELAVEAEFMAGVITSVASGFPNVT